MEIEEIFKSFNDRLLDKHKKLKNEVTKEKLLTLGEFYMSRHLTDEEMNSFLPKGIAAVDGSNNSYGGADPNIIHFLRACYIPDMKRDRVEEVRILSPLVDVEVSPKSELSKLELIAAMKGLEKYDSKALLMDGGLIRYILDAEDEYNELLELVKERDTLFMGVIEDMKSRSISKALDVDGFDRELLFGKLAPGEAFFLHDELNLKKESSISTIYLRPGNDPMAISIDFPNFLGDKRELITNLVRTLTPDMSRGIPFILDIVDKYAKVTDKDMQYFIKKYISEDVKRLYLDEARQKRWM
ncbi:NurA domain-containing protein [Ezakiella coagulans]|uniref:NurA domain-containing protein n=1 Tax=Ezakiella coagulans TaxID=46507 RepID=A0A2U1E5F5_9FIRM|nr:DNA double-strand break repair nuclease NurA [Ezakiella coagulans]PVY95184.1 NurA domain-containing protein [Ezakiella coagulans]UQK60162.1 DNA double-strand break repair nuclease NurA [Ezakiella coagulans]